MVDRCWSKIYEYAFPLCLLFKYIVMPLVVEIAGGLQYICVCLCVNVCVRGRTAGWPVMWRVVAGSGKSKRLDKDWSDGKPRRGKAKPQTEKLILVETLTRNKKQFKANKIRMNEYYE